MAASPAWYRIVAERAVLGRAVITSLGVGTILTIANHAGELGQGSMASTSVVPILITYLVPFLVSCGTSVLTIRQRQPRADDAAPRERELEAIGRLPGQNPNPVLRMSEAGVLTYANASSAPIRGALDLAVGAPVGRALFDRLSAAAAASPPAAIEVESGRQTFAVLPIHVPEHSAFHLYGTDVTAAKVIERFPDRNTNPVLRMTPAGVLKYANRTSLPIIRALGVDVGDPLPAPVLEQLLAVLADPAKPAPEVAGEGGLTFRLRPVSIPEFEFVNLYGTDITAEKAMHKFPDQNPNPVLRLTRSGRMTYANPASNLVQKALGARVGDDLDHATFARIVAACEHSTDPTLEVEADGAVYRVRVVSVYEFDSINLYGTDITAALQVEALSAANERLLLNILPASIADRLRGGETVIADRFDDMVVLFADIVGFTKLSAELTPVEVVSLLNRIFTMCDELAERFHLEKIKTVGDAYMVVGGLPHGDHSQHVTSPGDVADMGLAMLEGLARLRAESGVVVEMRLGLHVGPAVAGVIGLKKFIYDVWGDTVNMASRMESTGVPGRLHVARETYERLGDDFEFEPRGLVEVKGKGQIETWFVVGRLPRSASSD